MKPEEALDLFRKWASEQTEVICFSRLHGWALSFSFRVGPNPTLSEVVFKAEGSAGGLKLQLDIPDMVLGYKQLRELESTAPEAIAGWPDELLDLSCVWVSLPLRLLPDDPLETERERLFFLEVPPGIDINPPSR